MNWRSGVVKSIIRTWPGVQELAIDVAGVEYVGLCYPQLVGTAQVGDEVLLTTNAVAKNLGTGGYGFVAAIPHRLPADPPPAPGHVMKARYTPLQPMVLGVDEQDSPHHEILRDADAIAQMPVVVADLHSALPAVIAGLRWHHERKGLPLPTVSYVMSDGGALPAWFSRTCAQLKQAGWLGSVITTGQAFGGDFDAVNIHTGLLAAAHVAGADVVVMSQGPGNLGTGTKWGFSGTSAGEAINAATTLGGRPIGCLRMSALDARERHQGISHHSLTAYGKVALTRADIPFPVGLEETFQHHGLNYGLIKRINTQIEQLAARHHIVEVPVAGLAQGLATSPVPLSTMGRGYDQDPLPFLAAAVAGVHAGALLANVEDCDS